MTAGDPLHNAYRAQRAAKARALRDLFGKPDVPAADDPEPAVPPLPHAGLGTRPPAPSQRPMSVGEFLRNLVKKKD